MNKKRIRKSLAEKTAERKAWRLANPGRCKRSTTTPVQQPATPRMPRTDEQRARDAVAQWRCQEKKRVERAKSDPVYAGKRKERLYRKELNAQRRAMLEQAGLPPDEIEREMQRPLELDKPKIKAWESNRRQRRREERYKTDPAYAAWVDKRNASEADRLARQAYTQERVRYLQDKLTAAEAAGDVVVIESAAKALAAIRLRAESDARKQARRELRRRARSHSIPQ